MQTLRSEVKSIDKNSAIIEEVWEDASNKISYGELRKYLCGNQLDSVMNYPLRLALIDYILCSIDTKTFNSRFYTFYENYPKEAFVASMNFLSIYDTKRILTRLANTDENLDHYAPIELGRFGVCKLIAHKENHQSTNGRFVLHAEPMTIKIYNAKTAYTKEKNHE